MDKKQNVTNRSLAVDCILDDRVNNAKKNKTLYGKTSLSLKQEIVYIIELSIEHTTTPRVISYS